MLAIFQEMETSLSNLKAKIVAGYHAYFLPVIKDLGSEVTEEGKAVAAVAASTTLSNVDALKAGTISAGDLAHTVLTAALDKAKSDAPAMAEGAVMSLAGAVMHDTLTTATSGS